MKQMKVIVILNIRKKRYYIEMKQSLITIYTQHYLKIQKGLIQMIFLTDRRLVDEIKDGVFLDAILDIIISICTSNHREFV